MKQSLERQIRNILREYPDAKIYSDKYTGTNMDRPDWSKLYKRAKLGDVIVFDSVSRMSRNAQEGFEVYEELYNRGIELVFLKEPHINTNTYKKALEGQISLLVDSGNAAADELIHGMSECINKYLLALAKEQIKLAFEQAEKEVQDIRQRTKEGIEQAKLKGKQIGREKGKTFTTKKSGEMKEKILKYSKEFGGSLTDAECMDLTGLSRNTYYKYKRELKG